jgi:ankyrin repeat protein
MIACTYDNLDVINKLLDRGADINAIDDIGKTPLMHCIPRSVVILNRLIERGAYIDARDSNGNTVLIHNTLLIDPSPHIAQNLLDIATSLIDHGADPAATDRDGVSVMDFAIINNYNDDYVDLIAEAVEGNKPEVDLAPHIGELKLNLRGNPVPITMNDFVNGQDYVRLKKNNRQLFDKDSLQGWFNTGKHSNPLTRNNIQQNNIERFTYKFNMKSNRRNNNNNGRPNTKRQKRGPINNNNNMPPVERFNLGFLGPGAGTGKLNF